MRCFGLANRLGFVGYPNHLELRAPSSPLGSGGGSGLPVVRVAGSRVFAALRPRMTGGEDDEMDLRPRLEAEVAGHGPVEEAGFFLRAGADVVGDQRRAEE